MSIAEAPTPVVTDLPQEKTTLAPPETKPTPAEKFEMGSRGVLEREVAAGNIEEAIKQLIGLYAECAKEEKAEVITAAQQARAKANKARAEAEQAKAKIKQLRKNNIWDRENRDDFITPAVVNNWERLQKFILKLKGPLSPEELRREVHQDEKGTEKTVTHINPAIHLEMTRPLKLVEQGLQAPKKEWSIQLGLDTGDKLSGDKDKSSPFFKFTRLANSEGRVFYRTGGQGHEFDSRQMETAEEFQQHMELAFGAIKELGVAPYLLDDLLPVSGGDHL